MNKRFLSLLLCLGMLLSLIPAAAIPAGAASTATSVVYAKTFEELRSALEANTDSVVILNGDIDIEIDRKTDDRVHLLETNWNYLILVAGTHRLDLNGHTFIVSTHFNLESDITGEPTEAYSDRNPLHKANLWLFYLSEGSSLTIDDSRGGGEIKNTSQMPGPWSMKNISDPGRRNLFYLEENSSLTINGGNFHAGRSKEQYVSEAFGLYWMDGELWQEHDFDPLGPRAWNDAGGRYYGDAYSVIPGCIAEVNNGSSLTINGGHFFALGRHYNAEDEMFSHDIKANIVINDGYFNSKQCRLLNSTSNVSIYGGEFQYDRYDVFLEVGYAYSSISSYDNIVTQGDSGNLSKDVDAFRFDFNDCRVEYDGVTYGSKSSLTAKVKKYESNKSHNIKITPRDKNDAVLSFMSDRSAIQGGTFKYLPGTSVNVYLGGPANTKAPYADPLTTSIRPNDDYGLKNILVILSGGDPTGQKRGSLTVTYDGDHFPYFDLNDYASGYTWDSGTEKGKPVAYTVGWTYVFKILYLYEYGGYHHYQYLVQSPNSLFFTPTNEIEVLAPWNDASTALESWSTNVLGVTVDSAALYRNGSIVTSVIPGTTIDVAFLLKAKEGGNIFSKTGSVIWNGKKQDKFLWDTDFTYAMVGASFHLTVPTPADGKQLTQTHINVTAPEAGKQLASAKQGTVMIGDSRIKDTTSTVMKTEWSSSKGTALPGATALTATAYTVSVTIEVTNKSTFKYTPNTLYYINDKPAKLVSISEDKKTAVIEYTFPATTGNAITTVGVTNILEPETGDLVEKSIANVIISSPSADSLQIKEIRWVNETTHASDVAFQEGNRYFLEITFRANEGSYFPATDGSYTGTAKINGSAAYSVNFLADNEIKLISKGFTPKVVTKAVREINITSDDILIPYIGDSPNTDIDISTDLTNGAEIVKAVWVNATTLSEEDEYFQSGCDYYLKITIDPSPFHYFPITVENEYAGTVFINGVEARRVKITDKYYPVQLEVYSEFYVPAAHEPLDKVFISVPKLSEGETLPTPTRAAGYEKQVWLSSFAWTCGTDGNFTMTANAGDKIQKGYQYKLTVQVYAKGSFSFSDSAVIVVQEGCTSSSAPYGRVGTSWISQDFTFSLASFLWGDANGDDKVDSKDLSLLRKYMAAYDYTSGTSTVAVEAGADANGDGKIDSKDLSLLRKFMAAYDYTTGTSTVVLGPTK